jgi:ssRNA-specific RNase YbeY (16S rRNA maturation enzyme)
MRALNKKWRSKDSATDVLSFEVTPDEFDMVRPQPTRLCTLQP